MLTDRQQTAYRTMRRCGYGAAEALHFARNIRPWWSGMYPRAPQDVAVLGAAVAEYHGPEAHCMLAQGAAPRWVWHWAYSAARLDASERAADAAFGEQ